MCVVIYLQVVVSGSREHGSQQPAGDVLLVDVEELLVILEGPEGGVLPSFVGRQQLVRVRIPDVRLGNLVRETPVVVVVGGEIKIWLLSLLLSWKSVIAVAVVGVGGGGGGGLERRCGEDVEFVVGTETGKPKVLHRRRGIQWPRHSSGGG